MAWRIHESVVRGEIDNRERGRVTGRIWFVGRAAPVVLDLVGNAGRDLAGRRLEFVNRNPKPGDLNRLASRQTGVVGDCTASRKVRVPEVSMEELMERFEQRQPFPWHWGNCLYLEWFSRTDGRVVIESSDYQLTIAPEVAWEMTGVEEEQQRQANTEMMGDYMQRLDQIVAAEQGDRNRQAAEETPAEWEMKPFSEEEAEKLQEDSDRLADRIHARMEREGDNADYEKILEEELERRRIERGEAPPTPEQEAERAEWVDEMNRAAEEALRNPDPELEAEVERKHPLAEQAFELSIRVRNEPKARGWLPEGAGEEHPLVDLGLAAMKAGAKFAGALNGCAWPPGILFCGNKIVRLKRARGYINDALCALEDCVQQRLGDSGWIAGVQRELNLMGNECDRLIGELRERLERGFD